MPRVAREVIPGQVYHVTHRGKNGSPVFQDDEDYQTYIDILSDMAGRYGFDVWSYCLMPNHFHLIGIPADETSIAKTIRETNRRFSHWRKTQGHGFITQWKQRFDSFLLSEEHLLYAFRYVELNPVRAGLVRYPKEWPYSSVHAHLTGRDDQLVRVKPLMERVDDWETALQEVIPEGFYKVMYDHK